MNKTCKQRYFELFLKVSLENELFFEFSENLLDDLLPESFYLKLGSNVLDKEIVKLDSSEYQILFEKNNRANYKNYI